MAIKGSAILPKSSLIIDKSGQCFKTCEKIINRHADWSHNIQMALFRNGSVEPTPTASLGLMKIEEYMNLNKPIIVGVWRSGSPNPPPFANHDSTTHHYVVINGFDFDLGKYYMFLDPGTVQGANENNRLYIQPNLLLKGNSVYWKNGPYIVSQVRPCE